MTIFYFTATGNSLVVAKSLGGRCVSIPSVFDSDKLCFEDDAIGVVFPCHFSDIPMPVSLFLRKVTLNTPYLFGVVTYGEMCGDVCKILDEYGKNCGNAFNFITSICMVDNYVPLWDVESQLKKLPKKDVPRQLARLYKEVEERKVGIQSVSLFGRLAGSFTRLVLGFMGNPYHRHRVEESKCNGCGVCSNVCPMGNILMDGRRPSVESFCIGCGACTHHCPQNAIRWRGEKSRARYRNPSVSLLEIIHSARKL